MDLLSIIGLVVGLGAIVGGNALEGGHIGALLQGTALLIVGGGTVGAVILQTPFRTLRRALAALKWALFPPRTAPEETIAHIVNWSQIARKEGLLSLEPLVETESDDFARKGLQLLVDGSEPDTIRAVLELEMANLEQRDLQAAKVFESMGGYAPTIGIIGAVMGLIHVMQNLADPSKLGEGIAVAFVATIYGVGLANLVLLPIGNKLKSCVQRQTQMREMAIEGIVAISQGENPRSIESKLQGYLH